MAQQIDFYVLELPDLEARLLFCCRLAAKILSRNKRCILLVEDNQTAAQLDQYLWQFPPESFIPHSILNADSSNQDTGPEAVTIATADKSPDKQAVCINLRDQAPADHADIERLVEVVCQDPAVLATTREKYRFYRQLGYPLQSHTINASAV